MIGRRNDCQSDDGVGAESYPGIVLHPPVQLFKAIKQYGVAALISGYTLLRNVSV